MFSHNNKNANLAADQYDAKDEEVGRRQNDSVGDSESAGTVFNETV